MTTPVTLYVYDLSNGMARNISPFILGRRIEGIWHTAIVVYGNEYFFGGHGIACCIPGTTQLGPPHKQELLGLTSVTQDLFEEYLIGNSGAKFHGSSYNLLENNCNNFSDEVAKFLVGKGIDENIVKLPQRVLSSPMGPLLRPHLEKMSNVAPTDGGRRMEPPSVGGGGGGTPTAVPSANGAANRHHYQSGGSNLALGGSNMALGSWEQNNMYFPCYSEVALGTTDEAVLEEVEKGLAVTVRDGPLTSDDIRTFSRLYTKDSVVFARAVASLSHKSGFMRLLLRDRELCGYVSSLVREQPGGTDEDDIALNQMCNNFMAGLNQVDRTDKVFLERLSKRTTFFIREGPTIEIARCTYNIAGATLTPDQVMELACALIYTLPSTTSEASRLLPDQISQLDLLLKALYLLALKDRTVLEVAAAMGRSVAIFRGVGELAGIAGKIADLE